MADEYSFCICRNLADSSRIFAGEKTNKTMSKTIIERMCSIAEKMQTDEGRSAMSLINMENAQSDIQALVETLGLSDIQVVILTAIMWRSSSENISRSEIARTLGINYLQFLTYQKEMDTLRKKGYIRMSKEKRIILPRTVKDCLVENKPVLPEPMTGLSAMDLLLKIKRAMDFREYDQYSTEEMVVELNDLMELNPENSVSRGILSTRKNIPMEEQVILYALVFFYYFEDDDMVGWHNLESYMSDVDLIMLKTRYKYETLMLQKEGIIEYAGRNGIMNKDHFRLKDSVKEKIFADVGGIRNKEPKVSASRKMVASEISPKELFYNPVERRQVEQLKGLMSETRLGEIRSKMKEKGLRTGFTCLFYGGPGTGKTETVYQIARESGRDLFIVDVSKIKSCWVGESEKNMKDVFDKYREAVKANGVIPILLFNEADAVFGVRREGAESAVDKMENSIQNIILQEMEDLDGILIATTNLTSNLDKAFERRFLYKIRFEKPAQEARKLIWKTMMPSLSEEEAELLAIDFPFSGGQIENIVRKREIKAIIGPLEPDFNDVRTFCEEESLGNENGRRRIGF